MTRTLLLLAAAVACAPPADAQAKRGTTFGRFLLIEPSAAVAAQGNVGATARADALSAYYNPGALGFQQESNAGFSHSAWLADIDFNYAAVALKLGESSTVALSVTSLSSGDIEVRTAEQPLGTGEQYSVNDLAIGVGLGRRFTDRFAAGAQVKFVQETIWRSSAQTVGLRRRRHLRAPVPGRRPGREHRQLRRAGRVRRDRPPRPLRPGPRRVRRQRQPPGVAGDRRPTRSRSFSGSA